MASERGTTSLAHAVYAKLIRFYPKPYRERFGSGMEQTFNDLYRERTAEGGGVLTFTLWAFTDTAMGIFRENRSLIFSSSLMQNSIIRVGLITLGLLVIPLVLTLTGSGVDGVGFHWTPADFVFAFIVIFGTGLLFDLARKKAGSNTAYKMGAGLILLGSFGIVWTTAAVGIIGEDNPSDLLFLAMVAVAFIASIVARFEPRNMSFIAFGMMVVQMIIPSIALMYWGDNFSPGVLYVFVLNAVFATIFLGSGLLFGQAAQGKALGMKR